MFRVESMEARTAAVLHDVVEDCEITPDQLRAEGFSEPIVAAVESLTKREGETYDEFIERAGRHPIALQVKIADLTENLDVSRLGRELTEKDRARVAKYERSLAYLRSVAEK
jgi:(p)ppGpp synthase/HD superfamily hydrolase